MRAYQATFPVTLMCEVLRVSRSGFYAWRDRAPSARAEQDAEQDAELAQAIQVSHAASDGSYGAIRIHEDLKDEGFRVGRKRVARLMREHGIVGVTRRRDPSA